MSFGVIDVAASADVAVLADFDGVADARLLVVGEVDLGSCAAAASIPEPTAGLLVDVAPFADCDATGEVAGVLETGALRRFGPAVDALVRVSAEALLVVPADDESDDAPVVSAADTPYPAATAVSSHAATATLP